MNSIIRTSIRKVPEITAVFWATKLLTTGMGEATSDFLVYKINPYLAVLIGAIVFVAAILFQFKVKKYIPLVYWFAVAMVAVFGTMAADATHKQLGVPYTASTLFFGVILAIVFVVWHKIEKTLSIHSINSQRREIFYWLVVLSTFALGTAAGDLTAYSLGLGYFTSAILFSTLILIPAVGFWLFGLNEVIAFWTAYIITRPLGASFADWIGKPKSLGGLGFGDGKIALVLTILIIGLVIYMTISKTESIRERLRSSRD